MANVANAWTLCDTEEMRRGALEPEPGAINPCRNSRLESRVLVSEKESYEGKPQQGKGPGHARLAISIETRRYRVDRSYVRAT